MCLAHGWSHCSSVDGPARKSLDPLYCDIIFSKVGGEKKINAAWAPLPAMIWFAKAGEKRLWNVAQAPLPAHGSDSWVTTTILLTTLLIGCSWVTSTCPPRVSISVVAIPNPTQKKHRRHLSLPRGRLPRPPTSDPTLHTGKYKPNARRSQLSYMHRQNIHLLQSKLIICSRQAHKKTLPKVLIFLLGRGVEDRVASVSTSDRSIHRVCNLRPLLS